MSDRPSASKAPLDVSPTSTEALAKVLAELRSLTPAGTDSPPSFPPRLTRAETPTVRSRKIELEFEGERPPARRPIKAVAATAVLLALGAGAMNLAYPSIKGLVSTTSPALAEKNQASAAALRLAAADQGTTPPSAPTRQDPAPQRSEPALPASAVASASPTTAVPEPVEAGSISTTGATPTVLASAGPRLSGQPLQIPLPAPAPFVAIQGEAPVARAAPEEKARPKAAVPIAPAAAPEQHQATSAIATSAVRPALESALARREAPSVPQEAAPVPRETAAVPQTTPAKAPDPAPETKPVAPPTATATANQDRLIRRAGELIQEGDISGARLLLERALNGGSAQAAFALAQTYDPQVLAQWQARGIRGDPARARQLYQLASEKGIAGAKESIASLR